MKILTLTANLLAEFTGEYSAFLPGKTQRADRVHFQVGGKGINVAKAAQRLGVNVEALYLAGGPMGDLCEGWLLCQPFATRAIKILSDNRAGWVVRSPGMHETTFLGADIPVCHETWAEFLTGAKQTEASHLALCGSVPGWSSAHTAATKSLFDEESLLFRAVDTYGPPLEAVWRLPWDLIKINRHEFDGLTRSLRPSKGEDFPESLAALTAASTARAWIITDGGGPVHLWTPHTGLRRFTPPRIKEVSPTGSGDVFLGILLALLSRGEELPKAIPTALHHAALNAAEPGVATYPLP